jgi:hypothetical protein
MGNVLALSAQHRGTECQFGFLWGPSGQSSSYSSLVTPDGFPTSGLWPLVSAPPILSVQPSPSPQLPCSVTLLRGKQLSCCSVLRSHRPPCRGPGVSPSLWARPALLSPPFLPPSWSPAFLYLSQRFNTPTRELHLGHFTF